MRQLMTIVLAIAAFHAIGQSKVMEVVASAGGSYVHQPSGFNVSWTLGETVIATFAPAGGSIVLTQGFQQGNLFVTDIPRPEFERLSIRMYPNPASVEVKFEVNRGVSSGDMVVEIYDIPGRKILERNFGPPEGKDPVVLNIHSLKPGIYLVNVRVGSTPFRVLKLVKERN